MADGDRARWQQVSDLLARALDEPPAARDRFIRNAAAGNAALEAELRSLLEAHHRASTRGFLDAPAAAYDPDLASDDLSTFIGRTIGPYVIKSTLGRGGMGVVFCAEDTRLGRTVALKAVAPEMARDERMRERLRREARAAAALSHPAIATVYSLEEVDGDLFIASEYVPGRTLRDELARAPLAPDRLMDAARAIAGALAAAHASGIVHRDLKPENVICREDGRIKVLDFGLARSIAAGGAPTVSRLTMAGALVGTPGYMAPEQLRGEPADARADVFSFGVLMYELATGRHPFGGGDTAAILAGIIAGRTPAPTAAIAPARLDPIVRRCLRPSPHERYSSGVELLAAIIGSGEELPPAPATDLWWWQFHQVAIAVFHSAMLVALWFARGWFGAPLGNPLFYAGLGFQTAAVTMRLHLWFTSRFHREQLDSQRRRVRRSIGLLDVFLQVLLLAAALKGAGEDAAATPLFLVAAIASLVSLLLIEPVTERAAFRSSANSWTTRST